MFNYSFFLFCKLYDAYFHPTLEYDLLFGEMVGLYEDYCASSFNSYDSSEYDCMESYIKSIKP
jgi:hypothetical protein